MQSAQPSHLRRRNSLSSRQTQTDLRRQSSSLVASRPKRLHISHAVQRPGTKEADHRLCSLPFSCSSYGSFQCHLPYQHHLITCRPASDNTEAKQGGLSGQTLGIIAFVGGLALVLGLGYLFKGKIRHFLDYFIERVDEWGPWGYVAYGVLYTLLEIVALPAIPLTMTAGVLFGIVPGTILVSGAATAAATIAFLIARYAARDKVTSVVNSYAAELDKPARIVILYGDML